MSYDIYIFRLRPGMTLDQARQTVKDALQRQDEESDGDEEDEEEEDDEEENEVALVADDSLSDDDLLLQLRKPWLRHWVAPTERTPSFQAWLDSPEDGTEMSDDDEIRFGQQLSYFDGWQSPPGSVLFCFNIGSREKVLPRFWEFAKEVSPLGYFVFDPQSSRVLDPSVEPPPE